jgi:transcriptional regulator with XRE-family HTH domain
MAEWWHPAKIEDRSDEMAKGTFGERLKRERELREVKLEEVASATRIAPRFLEALENEQWEKLPGGVFGRGFVRSIARYLGLSEEDLLSEYDLAHGETDTAANQKPEERIPSAPKWIPAAATLLLLGALVGVFLGGRYAWRAYMAHRAAKKSSSAVSLPAAPSKNLGAMAPANSPAAGAEKQLPLELAIAAAKFTHVRMVTDREAAFDAELEPGRNLHFSAHDRFEVSAADSAAVLLELNGQTVPPPGVPGSSGTISLTAKDLRQGTGGVTQH